jgi:hypothetical protein
MKLLHRLHRFQLSLGLTLGHCLTVLWGQRPVSAKRHREIVSAQMTTIGCLERELILSTQELERCASSPLPVQPPVYVLLATGPTKSMCLALTDVEKARHYCSIAKEMYLPENVALFSPVLDEVPVPILEHERLWAMMGSTK